jgi:hypothetical protein
VRPYRGTPDRPSSRHLDALRAEHERNPPKQITFSFMDAADQDGPWFWLMAMESDAEGKIARVTYLQANDAGETRHAWECPLDEPVEVVEKKRATPPRSATRAAKPAVVAPVAADALDFPLPVALTGTEAPAVLHAG